ncbi:hypothetical protein MSG28_007193 [Choristoneura fumiferana]|uniref:Uncharacterized protein n=1 Tax=Choristoneura fumiferana TaxID=7141 RepID=A0ACC0JMU3_CHOFU|nr:hypothetical protein MSG28_007193 [Choristoneura fumiferana]
MSEKRVERVIRNDVVLSLAVRVLECDGRLLAPLDSLERGGRQADIAKRYLPRTHSQSQEEPVHSLSLPGPGKDQSLAPNLAPIRVNMHLRSRRQDAEQPAEIVEETNNDKYDPNRGFEPYWPGGEWVFIKRTTKGTTKRTTTQPKLCGTTCNHLLKK